MSMPEAVAVTEKPEGPINTLVRQMSAATAQMRAAVQGAASAVTAEVQGAASAVTADSLRNKFALDEAGGSFEHDDGGPD